MAASSWRPWAGVRTVVSALTGVDSRTSLATLRGSRSSRTASSSPTRRVAWTYRTDRSLSPFVPSASSISRTSRAVSRPSFLDPISGTMCLSTLVL